MGENTIRVDMLPLVEKEDVLLPKNIYLNPFVMEAEHAGDLIGKLADQNA